MLARSNSMHSSPAKLLAADVKVCRQLLRKNSKTFYAASLLLPGPVRSAASVLYGFCRIADDEVDVVQGGGDAIAALRARLARATTSETITEPTDRALAAVLAQYRIPKAIPELLIEGLAWDAQGRSYETLDELLDYAARVAGTVGAMMALLMGVRSANGLARACELGLAMQLTNIARDVGEDARMGRIYLPLQWLREAGVDPEQWLREPRFDERIAAVVSRLLREASTLYGRVDAGVALLPMACRPGINAARFLYADIGSVITRAKFNSIDSRAVVSGERKLLWLMRSLMHVMPGASHKNLPLLPAIEPLLASVALTPDQPRESGSPPWWRLDQRLVWAISLFDRLERHERAGAMAVRSNYLRPG